MTNQLTAIHKDSPQPAFPAPLPVPVPRPPAEATSLRVNVQSTAPLVLRVSGEIDIASAPKLREGTTAIGLSLRVLVCRRIGPYWGQLSYEGADGGSRSAAAGRGVHV